MRRLDQVDVALIAELRSNPRASVSQLARVLGLARGTVQGRLQRLETDGVITGHGPDLDRARAGFGVMAFTTLAIVQGKHETIVDRLRSIPEVLEVHTVTGSGDLLCRIAARSNDHLHQVLQQITAFPEVSRSETQLALSSPVERTLADLFVDGPVEGFADGH